MTDLIERARLTDEEIADVKRGLFNERDINGQLLPLIYPSPMSEIADAQLGKAMWAVVDWLVDTTRVSRTWLMLEEELMAAGIERPKVEPSREVS